jgi:hypothetical protein
LERVRNTLEPQMPQMKAVIVFETALYAAA